MKHKKATVPISIIIPTKNEESHLPRLLQSIADQSVAPEEIIVADAKSQDKTREIAKSYGAKVVDGGIIAVGRNRGAQAAKTDMFLFFDADCLIDDPDYLKRAYNLMIKENYDVASSMLLADSYEMPDSLHARYIPGFIFNAWSVGLRVGNLIHKPLVGSGTGVFVKKSVFNELGGFNEVTDFVGEDLDFIQRAVDGLYNYGVLPLSIKTSARRYATVSSTIKAVLGSFISVPVLILGPQNQESKQFRDMSNDLYGTKGGGTKKE